jgi:hypothetical protein
MHISNLFGTYLGNRASKGKEKIKENVVAGAASEWKCEKGLQRRLWLMDRQGGAFK